MKKNKEEIYGWIEGGHAGVREEDAEDLEGEMEANDWLWPSLKGTAQRRRR